jgi:hypothetical protein
LSLLLQCRIVEAHAQPAKGCGLRHAAPKLCLALNVQQGPMPFGCTDKHLA